MVWICILNWVIFWVFMSALRSLTRFSKEFKLGGTGLVNIQVSSEIREILHLLNYERVGSASPLLRRLRRPLPVTATAFREPSPSPLPGRCGNSVVWASVFKLLVWVPTSDQIIEGPHRAFDDRDFYLWVFTVFKTKTKKLKIHLKITSLLHVGINIFMKSKFFPKTNLRRVA